MISRKAPYGYQRIPRGPGGPAHLEIFEPEAAVARRIFAARAAGTTIRQICRQLNAAAVPTPTGSRAVWGTSTINRLLRNEAYIGRVYYNRTETVPDRQPGQRSRQVPRPRADWIAIPCPAIIAEDTCQAAATVATTTPSGARAAPNRALAAARPGRVRALRRGHQLPQDARPQRHLASLLLLPQPRPGTRGRPRPPLPRAQHPRRHPR